MSLDLCSQWAAVISADIDELMLIRFDGSFPSSYRFYAGVVMAFLQNNVLELRRLNDLKDQIDFQPHEADAKNFQTLISLRMRLRLNEVDIQEVRSLLTLVREKSFLNGEMYFVAAMCFEKLNSLNEAKLAYERAQYELIKISCHKKALKCALNFLSCDSRLHPHQNYVADYENIVKQALLLSDFHSAGVALNNISQEYQRIQAPLIALKYANEAIEIFEKGGRRTVNYYMSYLQRCHILFQLNRKAEAYLDYQHCLVAKFPAVMETIKFLAPSFGESTRGTPDSANMTYFWQERAKKEPVSSASPTTIENLFTESESKILHLLSVKSSTRWEIIEQLYGKTLDPLVAENRVKVFLSKIRKKRPGLIVIDEGRYSLSRDLYPELKIKAVK
ncbi:MAG: hypothetical protein ACXVCP_16115 [Bdellovibrio sp.]